MTALATVTADSNCWPSKQVQVKLKGAWMNEWLYVGKRLGGNESISADISTRMLQVFKVLLAPLVLYRACLVLLLLVEADRMPVEGFNDHWGEE